MIRHFLKTLLNNKSWHGRECQRDLGNGRKNAAGMEMPEKTVYLEKGLVLCPNCAGTGYITMNAPLDIEEADDFMNQEICMVCNGLGNIPETDLDKWGLR